MASVSAKAEADGFTIFGKRGGIYDEVGLWLRLFAAPEADLVIDEVNARGTLDDIVGANDFMQMHADFCGGVRHGQTDQSGIFFEPAPMAFVSEGFAAGNADSREQAPAAEEAGLPWRQASPIDRQQAIVVKDVPVNQCAFLRKLF